MSSFIETSSGLVCLRQTSFQIQWHKMFPDVRCASVAGTPNIGGGALGQLFPGLKKSTWATTLNNSFEWTGPSATVRSRCWTDEMVWRCSPSSVSFSQKLNIMDIINNFATKFVPNTQSASQSLFIYFFLQMKSDILILLVRNCVYKFSTDNLKALKFLMWLVVVVRQPFQPDHIWIK